MVAVLAGEATRSISTPIAGEVWIDACIAAEIADLNRLGIRTTGCCCARGTATTSGSYDAHGGERDTDGGWITVDRRDAGKMRELGYVERPVGLPNYATAAHATFRPRSL